MSGAKLRGDRLNSPMVLSAYRPVPTTYYYYDRHSEECRSELNSNSCQLPYQFVHRDECVRTCLRRH
ncbi:unnamed protein product, partial [Mesorhabditis spiculigera]